MAETEGFELRLRDISWATLTVRANHSASFEVSATTLSVSGRFPPFPNRSHVQTGQRRTLMAPFRRTEWTAFEIFVLAVDTWADLLVGHQAPVGTATLL